MSRDGAVETFLNVAEVIPLNTAAGTPRNAVGSMRRNAAGATGPDGDRATRPDGDREMPPDDADDAVALTTCSPHMNYDPRLYSGPCVPSGPWCR